MFKSRSRHGSNELFEARVVPYEVKFLTGTKMHVVCGLDVSMVDGE